MANHADMELLNNALQNTATIGLKKREMQQEQQREMDRIMLQREMMANNQQRYQQQDKLASDRLTETTRHNTALESKAEQPKVSAFLSDPDNPDQGITVNGTYESIQGVADNITKTKGKPPVIMPKPPTDKPVHRSFKVGAMTIDTYNDADTQKITDQLKAQGVDPAAAVNKDPHEINIDPTKSYATANGHVILPKRSTDPTQIQTETEDVPANPGSPEDTTFHLFSKPWLGTTTNSPAIPAQPAKKITRKVKVTAPPVSTPAAPISSDVPVITSPEQHAALAPGATYKDADGNIRRKAAKAPNAAASEVVDSSDEDLTGDN